MNLNANRNPTLNRNPNPDAHPKSNQAEARVAEARAATGATEAQAEAGEEAEALRAVAEMDAAGGFRNWIGLKEGAAPAAVAAAPAAAADAAAAALSAAAAAPGAADAAAAAADAPPELIKTAGAGIFTPVADLLEAVLKALDGGLEALHVPYSYGFAIILLTVAVKTVTLPLTKKQIESSTQLQLLQPRVKDLQEEYKNDPETLQVETAKLYKRAQVNPLAGCLPVLVTLPVFIGLYRALSAAANEGLLTEGFFWIPSLSGPTSAALKTGGGLSWLAPFVDGAPPVGWHDALCYLSLPVILVASQYASTAILQGNQQSTDPSQQQTQAILKFLPLMLGWFSLNVPSGLALYWVTNNFLSVGQTILLKKNVTLPPELDDDPDFGIGNDGSVAGAPKRVAAVQSPPPPARREGAGERFKALKAKDAGTSASKAAAPPQTARGQKFAALKADTASSKPRADEMSDEVVVAEVTEISAHGNGNAGGEGGEVKEPVPATASKSGASVLRKKKGGKRSR